jgi:LysR family transcriptional regulator, transcriptional activator of nhaA
MYSSGMAWLNYHHLLYFWTVAREGTVGRAAAQLHLTQPTISGQLRALEKALGTKLFNRVGRNLVLSDAGRIAYRYADEIFSLGREFRDTLQGRPFGRTLPFAVGVVNTLPTAMIYQLLQPALHLAEPVQIICEQGTADVLHTKLALNALDVVLADAPLSPNTKIRAFNHLLGECGVSIMGVPKLAAAYRRGFPKSLNGVPFLLPAQNTALRRSLEQWFDTLQIKPKVRGEFDDTALLKVFGQHGAGVFAVRSVLERDSRQLYQVQLVGRVESIRERCYAISVERKLKHPAVVAITEAARQKLFA